MGILPPTNEQIYNYFKGGTTGLELRSAEREHTEIDWRTNFRGCTTRDSNVRRSREATEKGSDVWAIVDCGCGVIANGKLA